MMPCFVSGEIGEFMVKVCFWRNSLKSFKSQDYPLRNLREFNNSRKRFRYYIDFGIIWTSVLKINISVLLSPTVRFLLSRVGWKLLASPFLVFDIYKKSERQSEGGVTVAPKFCQGAKTWTTSQRGFLSTRQPRLEEACMEGNNHFKCQ